MVSKLAALHRGRPQSTAVILTIDLAALVLALGVIPGCQSNGDGDGAGPTPPAATGEPVPAAAETPPAAASGVGPAGSLTAYTGPLLCAGTEDLVLANVEINVEGDGPTVQGSCDVIIQNSRISDWFQSVLTRPLSTR